MNPVFVVNRDPIEAEAIKRNFEGLPEVEGLEIVHLRSTQEVDMWLGGEEGGGRARAPGVAMIVGAIPGGWFVARWPGLTSSSPSPSPSLSLGLGLTVIRIVSTPIPTPIPLPLPPPLPSPSPSTNTP
jgi:hypothetical protein